MNQSSSSDSRQRVISELAVRAGLLSEHQVEQVSGHLVETSVDDPISEQQLSSIGLSDAGRRALVALVQVHFEQANGDWGQCWEKLNGTRLSVGANSRNRQQESVLEDCQPPAANTNQADVATIVPSTPSVNAANSNAPESNDFSNLTAQDERSLQSTFLAAEHSQLDSTFIRQNSGSDNPQVDTGHATSDAAVRSDCRYKIVKPHARGGLGQVYVGMDTELGRHVALKEIRPEFVTDQANRGRFVVEAEITGKLEHPGIVPVYGLGAYADGRPYYAMRFIEGESLQQAIRTFHASAQWNAETVAARASSAHKSESEATARQSPRVSSEDFSSVRFRKLLGRFVDVCNAVGYAHARGVLHRDLKPGNVMLGPHGETLVVDWGLAKATGQVQVNFEDVNGKQPLTPSAVEVSDDMNIDQTLQGTTLGTPGFMSPEQAAGEVDALTPATDIYALGATLYVLLTGQRPYSGNAVSVVQATLKNDFPPPLAINSQVPKPLDAVCLRAMALDPAERYASCSDLADELERYLADERVHAFEEPWTIRARRWVRKHRTFVTTTAATAAVALIGLAIGLFVVGQKNADLKALNIEEARQRQLAENRRQKAEELTAELEESLEQTRRQRDLSEKLATTFVESFDLTGSEPLKDGQLVKVTDVLDQARRKASNELKGQPELHARFIKAIVEAYLFLNLWEEAEVTALVGLKVLHENKQGLSVTFTEMLDMLALAVRGQDRLKESTELKKQVYERLVNHFGEDSNRTIIAKSSYENDLALLNGQLVKSNSDDKPVDAGTARVLQLNRKKTLAKVLESQGRYAEALPLRREIYEEVQKILGPRHTDTLRMKVMVAQCLQKLGQYDEAIRLRQAAVSTAVMMLGPNHEETHLLRYYFGIALTDAGRFKQAEEEFRKLLPLMTRKYGPFDSRLWETERQLARLFRMTDRTSLAVRIYEIQLSKAVAKWTRNSPQALRALYQLATLLIEVNQSERCVSLLKSWEPIYRNPRLISNNQQSLPILLGMALRKAGRFNEARSVLQRSVRELAGHNEKPHSKESRSLLRQATSELARLAEQTHAWGDALKWHRQSSLYGGPAIAESAGHRR